jgi:hypothetical protein
MRGCGGVKVPAGRDRIGFMARMLTGTATPCSVRQNYDVNDSYPLQLRELPSLGTITPG